MALRVASLMVTNLTSTSLYADKFIVEIYSDVGLTTKVASQACAIVWDATAGVWKQKTAVAFNGLTYGTTYYLRAGVAAPISGVVTWTTSYSVQAGTPNPPSVTYGGTFGVTNICVNFEVTPTTARTDIDHYEWVWTLDGSTPPSTATYYGRSYGLASSAFHFFVAGRTGVNVTAYVRAVSTAADYQAWTSLGTFTIGSTWSGTLSGTVANGSLLGTGGAAVQGSSGNSGLVGVPTKLWEIQGPMQLSAAGPVVYLNDTQASGAQAQFASGTWNGVGTVAISRATTAVQNINGSGVGLYGSPSNIFQVQGARGVLQGTAPGWQLADTQASGATAYYLSGNAAAGTSSLWHTSGANRYFINSTGHGIQGMPAYAFHVQVPGESRVTGSAPLWRWQDTNVSGTSLSLSSSYGGVVGLAGMDVGLGSKYMAMNTTGVGFQVTPAQQFIVQGSGFANYFQNNGTAGIAASDTTVSTGRRFSFFSRSGTSTWSDETAALIRTTLDASGNTGFGGLSPVANVDSNGKVYSRYTTDNGFYSYDRANDGSNTLFYANTGTAKIWNSAANADTMQVTNGGKVGLGATPTTDWISVQGSSVLDSNKNVKAVVNQSTNFTAQGNIIQQDYPTWSVSVSGTANGNCTVTLSVAAKTMYRGDGSSWTLSAQSFQWTGLNTNTTYYFYPCVQTSDNSIHFASANTPSPSSTYVDPNTTPLTAASILAGMNANQDGRYPVSNGHISATTPLNGGGGGGSSGGGGTVCPEKNEIVTTKRGKIAVGAVMIGDFLKGKDLKTGEDVWHEVAMVTTAPRSEWRRYNGKRISPGHPVRHNAQWVAPKDIPGTVPLWFRSLAVHITLKASEYDEQNYLLGEDEDVLMHNSSILSC